MRWFPIRLLVSRVQDKKNQTFSVKNRISGRVGSKIRLRLILHHVNIHTLVSQSNPYRKIREACVNYCNNAADIVFGSKNAERPDESRVSFFL